MRRLFTLLVLLACAACATRSARPRPDQPRPLVILISFDGWRWDYDRKGLAPNLTKLASRGVRAEGLVPSFPTKTFPNLYSIATGLYPGRHGLVANVIYDPATGRRFDRFNLAELEDPFWWGGEPIWNTAQRGGLLAATMFWTGSEAPIGGMHARYWREFDENVPSADRVDQVLAWLDLPPSDRPSFITLYLNETDTMGHFYGPDSPQVRDAIERTDVQLGRLVEGLEKRALGPQANVVVVSDHGMASTTRAQTIVLEDHVSLEGLEIADINPTLGVIPASGQLEAAYRALVGAHPHLRMYRREETPPHWRLRDQPRVAPLTGVADEGWVVLRRAEVDNYWRKSSNGGQHGYDPLLLSMRGLFVAAGPAFKEGARVPAFENIHVYNALAMILGVPPASNDGDPAVARTLLR